MTLKLSLALLLLGCTSGPESKSQPPEVESAELATEVCAAGETVFGIDVSYYQGQIDWSAVAASGVRYAFIRTSDGLTHDDHRFAENWAGAQASGVMRGAYQFFRPGQDPIAQADFLLGKMGELAPGDLPPVVDVEATDGQPPGAIVAGLHAWIDRVRSATGVTPILYTGRYFWQDYVGSADFADLPLWIAAYGVTCPNLPAPWTSWAFHQTSSSGSVPGIAGPVDTNLFNGSEADLAAFAAGGENARQVGAAGTVGRNADGSLELFARGLDGSIWHAWQQQPLGEFSQWESLGGLVVDAPAVASGADDQLVLVVRGADDTPQVAGRQETGAWDDWAPLPGQMRGAPVLVANADRRLEAFVRGTDRRLYHAWQEAPDGGWSGWHGLGGGLRSSPAVGVNQDGRLEVFVTATDRALWHIWQTAPGGAWSGWESLGGGLRSSPAVGVNQDGRLEVVAVGDDGAGWHIWQTASGGWSGWESLGGSLTADPAIARNADGRLEVFAVASDDALWHTWQLAPDGAWSASWEPLGGTITGAPWLGVNADGRLQAFAIGTDRAIWSTWQTTPGGSWSSWCSLEGGFAPSGGDGTGSPPGTTGGGGGCAVDPDWMRDDPDNPDADGDSSGDADDEGGDGPSGSGCSTSRGGPGGAAVLLLLLLVSIRRRS